MAEEKPMELNDLLKIAIKHGASDIHLKPGSPPRFRLAGGLKPYEKIRLTPDMVNKMAYSIMNQRQKKYFEQEQEIDLAYGVPGLGRFRVNIFYQRGTIGIVLRVIPFKVMTLNELNLPKVVGKISGEQRGLILVTGTTGSGKSTTLAAMINIINEARECNIVTIEDPIEILHRDKRSIINQREVGLDTKSFARALKSALRQDPDVILVGEMRDFETITTSLRAADTGHLVLSTLHTIDAAETITRIINEFPEQQHKQVRIQLSSLLKGIISQRLVPRADNKGRIPAVEILVSTAYVRDCIMYQEKFKHLNEAIAQGFSQYGMQTFDQSLMFLYKHKLITLEEALKQSSNPADFKLKLSGITTADDPTAWEPFAGDKDDDDPEGGSPAGGDLEIERF